MTADLVLLLELVALKATILMAAAGGAAFALRNRAASLRATVWQAGLAAVVLLPVLALLLPSWRVGLPTGAMGSTLIHVVGSGPQAIGGTIGGTQVFAALWMLGLVFVAARVLAGNW